MSGKRRPAGQPWLPMRRIPVPPRPAVIPEDIAAMLGDFEPDEYWINDRYQVLVFHHTDMPIGFPVTELSIRREDREYPRDWRHFQRIKNDICGPEREACELFPAESRLVDGANQFHLWVLPEGQCFPFGLFSGRSVHDDRHPVWKRLRKHGALGKQRPVDQVS